MEVTVAFGWAENVEESLAKTHIKPVVDYVSRLSELILLSAAFRVASDHTHSLVVAIFSYSINITIGFYLGIPLAYANYYLKKFKTKSFIKALAISIPLAIVLYGGLWLLTSEVVSAVKDIAKPVLKP